MHPVPVETRHNLTRPLARGGRYITRAPFHDFRSIRETWRPSHLFLITPFDPRAHLSPFSLFLLSPPSLSPFPPRSRNIVRSDYAVQCVAFNSTPRPVQDPPGVVRLKRKQEGGSDERRTQQRRAKRKRRALYRNTLMCHLTEIPPMRRIDLQPDVRGQKCTMLCACVGGWVSRCRSTKQQVVPGVVQPGEEL